MWKHTYTKLCKNINKETTQTKLNTKKKTNKTI